MARTALIAGSTGIVGNTLARHLADEGWTVHGLARNPGAMPGVAPVPADLTDPASLTAALADLRPSHLFIATWMRRPTEAENCAVNGAMVRNLLDALAAAPLEHVALVTGLKHYLGPFEAYGHGTLPATPFRETQGRLPVENFYYVQEDAVLDAARARGFGWSVHRPHTMIGFALGNAMNMGVTLAAYASLCGASGRPFVFPGSPQQWHGLTDMTDARLLARHLAWASTGEAGRDQAFNVVERRRIPLELDVGAHRDMVRHRSGSVSGKNNATRNSTRRCRRDLGRYRGQVSFARSAARRARIAVAYGRRSRASDRSHDRYEQEPQDGFSRLSGDGRQLLRPVRAPAG